jgi:chemotaxis protein methyltransferase CheR
MNLLSSQATEGLETADFLRVSEFIQEHYGIQLPLTKKKMVEARLQKRLKALQMNSFKDYLELVFGDEGSQEYGNMIDLITTNKTDFFREPSHFDFLTHEVLPELIKTKSPNEPLRIWSAASSSGEEVYSALITLEEFFLRSFRKMPYRILGTDLSMHVLKKAVAATYEEERISSLPLYIKKRYFLKSKNSENSLVRVKPEFLKQVQFKRLNLLKPFNGIDDSTDIIFCRNVLIYFSREVQEKVVSTLSSHLRTGGYLFIGHAESISNMDLPLVQVRPTIYKKIKL